MCVCVCERERERETERDRERDQSLSCVRFFATPWNVAHQAPLSMGFSRQEHWRGLPFPPPGDLSDPGTELVSFTSPALAGRFLTISATWEAPVLVFIIMFVFIFLAELALHMHLPENEYSGLPGARHPWSWGGRGQDSVKGGKWVC